MADVPIFIRCGGSWINLPDGSEAYSGGNVASLCVPKDVKYQEFLHILYDRFGINPDEFAVTTRALYKTWVPSSIAPYKPADIGNDGDLKAFIYINTNYVSALGGLTPMCITSERRGPKDPRNNQIRNNQVRDVNDTLAAVRERNNQVSDVNDTLPAVQEKTIGRATSTGGPYDPRNNPVSDVNGTLPAVRERAAGLTNSTGGPRDPRNNPVSDFHDTLPAVQEKTVGRATSKGGSCDPRNNPVSDVNGTLPAVRERTAGLTNSTGGPRDPRNNPVSDVNDTLPAVRERTVGHTTSTGPEHCSSTHHNEDPKHNCSDSESTMRVNKISGKECRRNYPEEPANVRKDFGAGDLQSQAHSRQRSNSLAHQHNISSLPSFSKGLPAYMRFENPFDTSLNSGNSNVYVGQIFNNKQDLRKKLSMMALRKRFQFKTLKSSKDRFEVKCLDNQCKWRVRATSDKNNGYFQVRRIDTVHSCEPVQLEKGHRQATSKLIAELVKDRIYGPKNI
ncbi:MuDR family transposase [Melia azedarach]|uniref:MuDR family transposase n=1 Tax=Melia azedarach TaxID=155640 RepID=A0ACC1XQP2_MELAZ|nr:MuDR family transposase [Melia azedarach]